MASVRHVIETSSVGVMTMCSSSMKKTAKLTRRTLMASTAAISAAAILPRYANAAEFEYKMGHSTMSIIDAGKFYEVRKFCSMTNHVWDGHWITFNKTAWERLPDDIKAVVARGFNEGAVAQRAELAQLNNTLQADLEKKGMTFNKANTQASATFWPRPASTRNGRRSSAAKPGRIWKNRSASSAESRRRRRQLSPRNPARGLARASDHCAARRGASGLLRACS